MRLLYAMLTAMALGISTPALALDKCQCLGGYPTPVGVHCTHWGKCGPLLQSAPIPKEVRSNDDCPDNRALLCDGPKDCKLVCEPKYEKKK